MLEPSLRGTGAPPPEASIARVVQWYKGCVKENSGGYGSAEDGTGTRPARKGVGEVSGNTFLLMIILMMILLFILISFGPLIFF